MSYVEIFAVMPNGDVRSYDTAHNNHGYGPHVWSVLLSKYGLKSCEYTMADPNLEKLWAKFATGELSREDDIMLGSTFDRIWLRADGLPELLAAQRSFHEKYVAPTKVVHTVRETAEVIEKASKEIKGLRGIAFNMCSAVSAFWHVQTEDDEESRPWNIDSDTVQQGGEYKGKGVDVEVFAALSGRK